LLNFNFNEKAHSVTWAVVAANNFPIDLVMTIAKHKTVKSVRSENEHPQSSNQRLTFRFCWLAAAAP